MNKIAYKIFFFLWYVFSLLPLPILYFIADILYYPTYYLIRYRRKVVRNNLTTSFPEKSRKEIKRTEKQFYKYLCDNLVETVKLMSISKKEIRKRMVFENAEIINKHFDEGKPCSMCLGHYGNWEWMSSIALWTNGKGVCSQIYHPLENSVSDALFLKIRGRFGSVSVTMDDTYRTILSWKRDKVPHMVGYISDQTPSYNIHYWTDLLHHDTPVYTGAEKISRVTDASVYYVDVKRIKRGYYRAKFIEITTDIKKEPIFSVTERYFRMLENSIKNTPYMWLWTHNRWKRTREVFNTIHNEEERKRLLSRL